MVIEERLLHGHSIATATPGGKKVREWASIAAVPVVPLTSLRRGMSPEEVVGEQYPGRFERMRILVLRRLRAAVLVPRARQVGAEMQLPVPALALNRRRSPREGVVQVATARGFDLYHLHQGRLLEVRSSSRRITDASDLTVPGTIHGLRAIDHVRSAPGHGLSTNHAAIVVFAIALATRVAADGIDPPPSAPAERRILPQSPPTELSTIGPLAGTLIDLAGAVPGFSLNALELGRHGAVVRFLSEAPVTETAKALEKVVPAEWHRTVRREEGSTTVVLEADYE